MQQDQPPNLLRPYVLRAAEAPLQHPPQSRPGDGSPQPGGEPETGPTPPAVDATAPLDIAAWRAARARARAGAPAPLPISAGHPREDAGTRRATIAVAAVVAAGLAVAVIATSLSDGAPSTQSAPRWGTPDAGAGSPSAGTDTSPPDAGAIDPVVPVPGGPPPAAGPAAGVDNAVGRPDGGPAPSAPGGTGPGGPGPGGLGPGGPGPGGLGPGGPGPGGPAPGAPAVPEAPAAPPPAPTTTTAAPGANPPADPPKPPQNATAYTRIEGESFDGQNGVRVERNDRDGGAHAGFISDGDWVRYDDIGFTDEPARSLLVRASNDAFGGRTGQVELRLDRRSNAPIGRLTIPNNGDWFAFSTHRMSIPPTTGVHTVYLTFVSRNPDEFANIDWITFTR